MAARTRREALRDLVENHGGPHPNEGPARIAKIHDYTAFSEQFGFKSLMSKFPGRFLGGSVKRRERTVPLKPQLVSPLRGALSWLVDVQDHSLNIRVSCVLGLSFDALVLLERPSGVPVFITPTHSIIGWANTESGLKIYYDHGDMLAVRCVAGTENAEIETSTLLERLNTVSKGEEAREVVVRRARQGEHWGFHIQDEGVVTDVEMYQTAWKAGLRQGSRIVEIEGQALTTLSMERICEMLTEKEALRLFLIAPATDGSPRRGCEDPNCVAMRGTQDYMLTPDAFARQPITYGDMLRLRARDMDTSPHSSPLSSNDGSFSFVPKLAAGRFEAVSVPGVVNPSIRAKQSLGASNNNGSSVSDGLSQLLLHAPKLNRAFSDEFLRLGRNQSQDGDNVSHGIEMERLRAELSRSQMQIEKLTQENRRLEDSLRIEKLAHDSTRSQLILLQAEQTIL